MSKLRVILLSILIFNILGYSCNKSNNQKNIIKVEPEKAVVIPFHEFIDSLVIIKLDSKQEAIIGEIDKVDVFDNLIFLLDRFSEEITCFNLNGKFQYKISKKGRGPNEYIDLETFYIDEENKHIVISERARKRLLKFDINTGKFISVMEVGFYIEDIIKTNNKIVLSSDSPNKSKLMVFNNDLTKCYISHFPYRKGIDDFSVPNIFTRYKNHILFAHGTDDIIYELKSNKISPLIYIDFGKNKIDKNFFTGDLSRVLKKRAEYFQKKYASFIHELHENKNFVSFLYPFNKSFYQVFILKSSNKALNISKISLNDLNIYVPFPQTVYKDMYISILYPQNIDKKLNSNTQPDIKRIYESLSGNNAVLLIYSINENLSYNDHAK